MKLTKYEHACFTIEKDGGIIVIDPGAYTTDFIPPEGVVGVIITHEHADHFDKQHIAAIIDKNPDAVIIGHDSLTSQIEVFSTKTVSNGDVVEVGSFSLEFFGDQHATIHSSFEPVKNIGVMINDLLYYPGDSFTLPERSVDVLALPVAAPWLKISEVIDFLISVKPRLAFPTHDAVLSDAGRALPDRMIPGFAQSYGGSYQRLKEPIEI